MHRRIIASRSYMSLVCPNVLVQSTRNWLQPKCTTLRMERTILATSWFWSQLYASTTRRSFATLSTFDYPLSCRRIVLYATARITDFLSFLSLLSYVKLILSEIIDAFKCIRTLAVLARNEEKLVYAVQLVRFTHDSTIPRLVSICLEEIRRNSVTNEDKVSHYPSRVHRWKRQNV